MDCLLLSLTVAHNTESNLNTDHTAAVVLRPETISLLKKPNRKWERLDNLLMQKIQHSLFSFCTDWVDLGGSLVQLGEKN